MGRLPYLQLFIADFQSETGHLSNAECGAYIRLITLCWQQPGCRLRDDEEWLLRKLGASDAEEASAVRKVRGEFFVKKRGHWQNDDLSARFKGASEKSAHHRFAGQRGGQATARKRRENQSSVASSLLEAKSEHGSNKQELKPDPKLKPNLELEELSKPVFLERLKRVIGPGALPSAVDGCWSFVSECTSAGASEELILRVVEKQTKASRRKPIRSLRALASEIDAEISLQARVPESRVAPPIRMPGGRAGDCLRAIKAKHGEVLASSWLSEAEWTDDEVLLPNDFYRSKVDGLFGAVLQQHSFTVSSRATK